MSFLSYTPRSKLGDKAARPPASSSTLQKIRTRLAESTSAQLSHQALLGDKYRDDDDYVDDEYGQDDYLSENDDDAYFDEESEQEHAAFTPQEVVQVAHGDGFLAVTVFWRRFSASYRQFTNSNTSGGTESRLDA